MGWQMLGSPRPRGVRAFTLIELLVVVAIIALLISILLPSLSKARAQARTTLCASRIGQLTKALIVYSDDFTETPPFCGRGWEDCNGGNLNTVWPAGSGITLRQWAMAEDWILPHMPDYWMSASNAWPADARLSNGRLFPYARFEALYRCPEFEREGLGQKTQELFNYTRSMLGRKWFDFDDVEAQDGSPWRAGYGGPFGAPGPILRLSQAYSPSKLIMLLDEKWDRHCAAPTDRFQKAGLGLLAGQISGGWMAIDSIWFVLGNELGRYHGTARPPLSEYALPTTATNRLPQVKQGTGSAYDGHVETGTDPLPDRNLDPSWGIDMVTIISAFDNWLLGQIFPQRGKATLNIRL